MSDLFGGLSGLMKGLSGFMPQDDPDVKIMNAQNEINDLRKKETEIRRVGRRVMAEAHQFRNYSINCSCTGRSAGS